MFLHNSTKQKLLYLILTSDDKSKLCKSQKVATIWSISLLTNVVGNSCTFKTISSNKFWNINFQFLYKIVSISPSYLHNSNISILTDKLIYTTRESFNTFFLFHTKLPNFKVSKISFYWNIEMSLKFAKLSPSASSNLTGLTCIIIFLTPHPAHPGQVWKWNQYLGPNLNDKLSNLHSCSESRDIGK